MVCHHRQGDVDGHSEYADQQIYDRPRKQKLPKRNSGGPCCDDLEAAIGYDEYCDRTEQDGKGKRVFGNRRNFQHGDSGSDQDVDLILVKEFPSGFDVADVGDHRKKNVKIRITILV